ncbi:MAG: exodeoxyribonuclease III [Actinomycetota bacterium]
MRIATWNINSIRTRVGQTVAWAVANDADVVLLQETKCGDADFPFEAFTDAGYEVAHHGVDHWNGVAIASRTGLDDVQRGFHGPQSPPFDEPRIIAATCGDVRVWSVYVPNGRELDDPHYLYKLVWLERLRAELALAGAADARSVVAGDFNVAPADQDVYDPKRWRRRTHASPPERDGIRSLLDLGLVDLARDRHPDTPEFTWWNYRPGQFDKDHGLRIDLTLVSPAIADAATAVWVDRDARAHERPSDHAPLVLDL